jgi:hypothetical protein
VPQQNRPTLRLAPQQELRHRAHRVRVTNG